MPTELKAIANDIWKGKSFLNEDFTLDNYKLQRSKKRFEIVHLATHAEFMPGEANNSYILLWNAKLHLNEMPNLDLDKPQVELLVLSACRTAMGDEQAELGFGGLAVKAGVISCLGA